MAIAISGPSFPSIFLQISAKTRKRSGTPPPIFISTNPSHVNLLHLSHLFRSANFSCHRFPNTDPDGHVEPVHPDKLRLALAHSSVVVSVFCKPKFFPGDRFRDEKSVFSLGELLPVTELTGRLVGFGRAVSDNGLTASIHDVVWFSGASFSSRTGNWQDDS